MYLNCTNELLYLILNRQVDLEDEIRERNRGIALLQTKLQYTEQDNKRLTELCSRLKNAPRGLDVLDSLVSQQVCDNHGLFGYI